MRDTATGSEARFDRSQRLDSTISARPAYLDTTPTGEAARTFPQPDNRPTESYSQPISQPASSYSQPISQPTDPSAPLPVGNSSSGDERYSPAPMPSQSYGTSTYGSNTGDAGLQPADAGSGSRRGGGRHARPAGQGYPSAQ
jgi:hypothetical protein